MSAFEATDALPEDVLRLLSPEAVSNGLTELLRYILGAVREIGTVMVRRAVRFTNSPAQLILCPPEEWRL